MACAVDKGISMSRQNSRWLSPSGWNHRLLKVYSMAGSCGRLSAELDHGVRMRLPLRLHTHWWDGLHPDRDLFTFLVKHGGCRPGIFLDVGANIGIYSVMWGKATGRACLACEPVPSTAMACRSVLAMNGVPGEVVEVAASRSRTILDLTGYPGGANNRLVRERSMVSEGAPTIRVVAEPLDELVHARVSHDGVAAMKIDVEGQELDVLAGAEAIIRHFRPALVVECHCGSWEELGVNRRHFIEFVAGLGYSEIRERSGGQPDLAAAKSTLHLLCS
jgi:FkbM family methyltransferase